MAHATCPLCLARFERPSSGPMSCPSCGAAVNDRPSRRDADDEDAPRSRKSSRRRDDDEDDYDDDSPRRKFKKKGKEPADALVPLLLIGGVLAAVVIIGGFGYLAYRAVDRMASRTKEVAARNAAQQAANNQAPFAPQQPMVNDPGAPGGWGPPGANLEQPAFPGAVPGMGPPGIDPLNMQPPGGFPNPNPNPGFPGGVPPGFPQPNPGFPGGAQPGFPQPNPGFPQPNPNPNPIPNPNPGAIPDGFVPPGGPGGPGGFPQPPGGPGGFPQPPKLPSPPGMPQPPGIGGAATVTLSNLRRVKGFGASDELEVEYEYTGGSPSPVFDKLIVKTANGTGEVDLIGVPRQKGSVRIKAFGFNKFQGKVEVWMERKSGMGPLGGRGQSISNTLTLN